ncbi:MAG: hypothetical protein ACXWRE_01910 [Pseudobdellovibrionaceae bacterium]
MNSSAKYLILIIVSIFTSRLWAYPETVRHGYMNCMACHTSPQGGDLLSPYGRQLGKELFSRNESIFKLTNSEKGYLEIETPEWMSVGVNLRLLQAFSQSSVASKGQFVIMQMDIDSLFKILEEKLKFYAAIGRFEPSTPQAEWKDFIYTPRLWLQYQEVGEGEQVGFLRAGRFFPSYGINIPEHNFLSRRELDFNPGQERVAVEATGSNERYQLTGDLLFQRANFNEYVPEKGFVIQLSKVFGENSRAGINSYRSTVTINSVEEKKSQDGIFALMGWNEKVSILIQADRIYSAGQTGFLDLFKVNYEWTKGLEIAAFQEYYNADTRKTDPHTEAYGLETSYFPIPNFNLVAAYKKQKDSSQLDEYQDIAWLIAHAYF